MSPNHRLRVALAALGLSHAAAGSKLECSRSCVTHLAGGALRPGLALAVRIEALTGIPASAWITDTTAPPAADPAAPSEATEASTTAETAAPIATDAEVRRAAA